MSGSFPQLFSDSICHTRWWHSSGHLVEFTLWAFVIIDTIFSQGFIAGFLTADLSFGLLVERFRCHWIHFLSVAFLNLQENKGANHASCFGLPKLTAFKLRMLPKNVTAIWSIMIQGVWFCKKESVGHEKFRSHCKPNSWD